MRRVVNRDGDGCCPAALEARTRGIEVADVDNGWADRYGARLGVRRAMIVVHVCRRNWSRTKKRGCRPAMNRDVCTGGAGSQFVVLAGLPAERTSSEHNREADLYEGVGAQRTWLMTS
jgi:hypothetical protein